MNFGPLSVGNYVGIVFFHLLPIALIVFFVLFVAVPSKRGARILALAVLPAPAEASPLLLCSRVKILIEIPAKLKYRIPPPLPAASPCYGQIWRGECTVHPGLQPFSLVFGGGRTTTLKRRRKRRGGGGFKRLPSMVVQEASPLASRLPNSETNGRNKFESFHS